MKVILSRKGFDSGSGGIASPILTNGELLSMPIPELDGNAKYCDIKYNHQLSYFDVLSQLSKKDLICGKDKLPLNVNAACHLDPDLKEHAIKRQVGWKPLFGQVGTSQSHLKNNGVSIGDLFLFFGWFRNTILESEMIRFDPKDKDGKHIIFGYFQIGEILKTSKQTVYEWMKYHPHYSRERSRVDDKNTIYVASEKLFWNNQLPGAGTFSLDDSLILTKKDCKRSHWDLPDFFRKASITYHNEKSWNEDYFKCADRGQEFVISENEDVTKWAKTIIEKNSK